MFKRILVFILALSILCLSSCDSGSSLDKTFISKAFKDLTWDSTIDDIKSHFKDVEFEIDTKESSDKEKQMAVKTTTLKSRNKTLINDIYTAVTFEFLHLEFEGTVYDFGLVKTQFGFVDTDKEKMRKIFEFEEENAVENLIDPNYITYGYGLKDYSVISQEAIDKQRELHGNLNEAFISSDKEYYERPFITYLHSVVNSELSKDGSSKEGHSITLGADRYKMIKTVEKLMNSK